MNFTGKNNIRKLAILGMLSAISIALVYLIRFPMFLPFLVYDPADIGIFIGTFIFGPLSGFVMTIVVSAIQSVFLSTDGIIGGIMHVFATGSFVLVAGLIYKAKKTSKGLIISLIAGILTMTCSMILWNMLFTPLFMNSTFSEVMDIMIPAIIPFNLIKASVNGTLSVIVYKSIGRIVTKTLKNDTIKTM